MRSLQEGILNPSTSELLARQLRSVAGRTTFKDRVGNIVGAVKQLPKNYSLGMKSAKVMIGSGGNPSIKQRLMLQKELIKTHPKNFAAGAAAGAGMLALGGYAGHYWANKHRKQSVNASGLVRGSYVVNEGIIDDAKAKISGIGDSIGNAVGAVKNRIQTNIGHLSNGISSVTDRIKGAAQGVADTVGSIGDKVSNFASNTIGSKNVNKPGFKVKA